MSTYVLIEKYTVGAGGASSVTLGSGGTIPQTYTDLVVKASVRSTDTANNYSDMGIRFNSTTTGYSYKTLYGNGSAAGSFGGTSQDKIYDAWINTGLSTTSTFTNLEFYVPNYTNSSNKSLSMDSTAENNATAGYATMSAGLSNITTAITSINIIPAYGNFAQYSTFYLYGILKA